MLRLLLLFFASNGSNHKRRRIPPSSLFCYSRSWLLSLLVFAQAAAAAATLDGTCHFNKQLFKVKCSAKIFKIYLKYFALNRNKKRNELTNFLLLIFKEHSAWVTKDCMNCTCIQSIPYCEKIQCKYEPCEQGLKLILNNNQCCPVCQEPKQTCTYEGYLINVSASHFV